MALEIENELGLPLDFRQVGRSSAVRGGFLYQHLYGIPCLLTVGRCDGSLVIVERDDMLDRSWEPLRKMVSLGVVA